MAVVRVCELCGGEAVMYCGSDAAFLCWKCDESVHEVNFLVARHVRHPVCKGCKEVMMMNGDVRCNWFPICDSCSAVDTADRHLVSPSTSSSSSCISSTNDGREKQSKRTRSKSKQIELVRLWCGEIGVGENDAIVAVASRIFSLVCGLGLRSGSRRVWLAASIWMSVILRKTASSLEKKRRLEEVSGVAEKLILAAQARIVRMVKDRKISRSGGDVVDRKEGWGESC